MLRTYCLEFNTEWDEGVCVTDRDYIVATPESRRRSRLCHINMLKPYLDREVIPLSPVREEGKTVLPLSSAELIDKAQAGLSLFSADPTEMQDARCCLMLSC